MKPTPTAFWPCLLTLGLLVAGCAAPSSPADTKPSSLAPAAQPTVDEVTGSIAGTVTDDELRPIPGITAALVQNRVETRTDATGAFTFNDLPPAAYHVVFLGVGYEQTTRRVDVVAGEVTRLDVALQPLLLQEVYAVTQHRTALVKVGQWTVQHAQHLINQSAVNEQMCEPCAFNLPLQQGIVQTLTEAAWRPSVDLAVVNQRMGFGYIRNYTAADPSPDYIISETLSNRGRYVWTDAETAQLRGLQVVRLQVHGPNPSQPGIAFNQRVDAYTSFAINGPLPEGFTALPPP